MMIGACLSRSEDRVLLYAVNRQSRESGGLVISRDDLRSLGKESVSMECRRRKEWDAGGGRGVRFSDNSVKTGMGWVSRVLTPHPTQCRLFRRRVKTGKWSDGEQRVVETDGVREVSDDEMTRSRVWFLLCVGNLTCWVRLKEERRDRNWWSKVISRIVKVNIEVAGYYKFVRSERPLNTLHSMLSVVGALIARQ